MKTSYAIQANMIDELLFAFNDLKNKQSKNKLLDSDRALIEAIYFRFQECTEELFKTGTIRY
jgi:hypothetical protein